MKNAGNKWLIVGLFFLFSTLVIPVNSFLRRRRLFRSRGCLFPIRCPIKSGAFWDNDAFEAG